jgi:hypothetical protein
LHSVTQGFLFLNISHHPNSLTEENENVEEKVNLKEGFPSLKDLWSCEVISKVEIHNAPTVFRKGTVEEQVEKVHITSLNFLRKYVFPL